MEAEDSLDLSLLSDGESEDDAGASQPNSSSRKRTADVAGLSDDGAAATADEAAEDQQQQEGPSSSHQPQQQQPRKKKKHKKVLSEQRLKLIKEQHAKRGIVYMSRIPPHMKPGKLRQLLSQYGEIGRIYCTPEDPTLRQQRKKKGGNTGEAAAVARQPCIPLGQQLAAPAVTLPPLRPCPPPLLHSTSGPSPILQPLRYHPAKGNTPALNMHSAPTHRHPPPSMQRPICAHESAITTPCPLFLCSQPPAHTGKNFTEGWIEFEDKAVAKQVAAALNGQPIGGKKRSAYHFDLWNLKYLPKFKWDHLTEEIAYEKAVREQKLANELSAAKRERDFYLAQVDRAKAVAAISQRHAARSSQGAAAAAADGGSSEPAAPDVAAAAGAAGPKAPKAAKQQQQQKGDPVKGPTAAAGEQPAAGPEAAAAAAAAAGGRPGGRGPGAMRHFGQRKTKQAAAGGGEGALPDQVLALVAGK
jgi:ESF2/ABP1 family protein